MLSKRVLGKSYEAALKQRVITPLGLEHTGIKAPNLIQGYLPDGHPTPAWDFQALAGAGALRSTVADCLRFLEAHMAVSESPLKPAIEMALSARHARPNGQIALGWHIDGEGNDELVLHNGGTYGFTSFAAYNQSRQLGVVVLRNITNSPDATQIGLQLLGRLLA